jgi:hypothetical protein
MTQGEAVFQAVLAVFGNNGSLDSAVPETKNWSDEQKRAVHGKVFLAFKTGLTVKSSGGQDDESLLKYIPGLVNNWVRKDLRLNGGVKYTAKHPGSRTGSGDEALRAMKTLLQMTSDLDARAAIQTEIDKRTEELKPKTVINIELIPENLRQFIKQ